VGENRTKFCDLCKQESSDIPRTVLELHGVVITIGISRGGWGQRKDLVNWSGEVCNRCLVIAARTHACFDLLKRQLEGKPTTLPKAVELPKRRHWLVERMLKGTKL